jgi:hypothetical protein
MGSVPRLEGFFRPRYAQLELRHGMDLQGVPGLEHTMVWASDGIQQLGREAKADYPSPIIPAPGSERRSTKHIAPPPRSENHAYDAHFQAHSRLQQLHDFEELRFNKEEVSNPLGFDRHERAGSVVGVF